MATILTPQAVEVLRRACKNSKTRSSTMRDPRALLEKNGIKLADDVEVRIYQRETGSKKKHDAPDMTDAMLARDFNGPVANRIITQAFDAWWRANHGGCPFPTSPYTTTKRVLVCDVWGIAAGSKEWVQDVPGTAFGHWQYTDVHSVCFLSHWEEKTVTECLPTITLGP